MSEETPSPESPRLIRIGEVLKICALSRASLYREVKSKQFPAPVSISERSVAWLHSEVISWVEARIKRRGPS